MYRTLDVHTMRGKVELAQMLPNLLGSRKLTNCKTNGDLNRLAKNGYDMGVILMSFLPI